MAFMSSLVLSRKAEWEGTTRDSSLLHRPVVGIHGRDRLRLDRMAHVGVGIVNHRETIVTGDSRPNRDFARRDPADHGAVADPWASEVVSVPEDEKDENVDGKQWKNGLFHGRVQLGSNSG